MKTRKTILLFILLILMLSLGLTTAAAQEELPTVHVVIFFSPYCAHCEKVITQDLPPLMEQYGDQLVIIGIDVSNDTGSQLFTETMDYLEYPLDQVGVPFLLVGTRALVGSAQIPEELPILVAAGVGTQGIAWPEIPVILTFLEEQGYLDASGMDITPTPGAETGAADADQPDQDAPEPAPTEAASTPVAQTEPTAEADPLTESTPEPTPAITVLNESSGGGVFGSFAERFNRDPLGNGIAVLVLLFLIGVAVYIGVKFMQAAELKPWPNWVLVILLVAGAAIAVYLATSEVSGEEVICGPVGDCNAVQQSKYATLFGFLPVAVLGLIGYITIGISWWVGQTASGQAAFYAKLAMFLFALFGLLFFIYLTFLEPFVIGATCAWCVTSAIIMAFINLFTLRIILDAWAQQEE